MPKAFSQDTLNLVLSLLDSDKTHAQIIKKTGVLSAYITKVTRKHRPHLARSKGGCPRKLNPTAVRYAVQLVTNGNKVSTRKAAITLSALSGESIHRDTVRHALLEAGLRAVKKTQKPKLTPKHIKERIAFARAHKDWTVADWKQVLWSDKTTITRLWSDGVYWGWARPGEKLSDRLITPALSHGGGSFMFWGCMGWPGTGYGCKVEGSFNKEVYEEILGDEFTRSLKHLGMKAREVIYMHDNARPHKAKAPTKWLKNHGVECLEWPANSPDLNPIENLWAELKRRLGEYEEVPNGMLELWERVQVVWDEFAPEYCQKLIETMPRRMAMVLERKGKSIPY
ncbi:Transposable element Tcb2 transposase [Rhizoctonia solani]|uniref:Transposable element Tcb2 transposase n=1 Tax=Rhizoctonia solani TaxID=456999 RepID=A0A8H8SX94_9AGAM|nr:Transposable element Tcb2 transposase [Rhizoctonia solani]QRW21149.1 Transposable element Tcb2 transposase [Rhizoctonia solani]